MLLIPRLALAQISEDMQEAGRCPALNYGSPAPAIKKVGEVLGNKRKGLSLNFIPFSGFFVIFFWFRFVFMTSKLF